MEQREEARPSRFKNIEVKPSLLALVTEKEMRSALQKVSEMSIADKDKYSKQIMQAYEQPLLEIGFNRESYGWEIAQTILSAINMSIFGRTY